MKISRKLEYACRVLAQLGRHQEAISMVHIDRLAQAESIPSNYLVQILRFCLKNALHSNFEKTLKLLYALCQRMAGAIGLEPTTPGFGDRCSTS